MFSVREENGKFSKSKSVRENQNWTKKMSKNRIGKGFPGKHP
jgi:hypothetical protein